MALFGEKYGDVVRMVEVGDGSFSRELCGGTHLRSTAEIGLFTISGESSSAANVRRIEALTGPEAVGLMRRHDAILHDIAARLRTRPEHAVEALEARERELKEYKAGAKRGDAGHEVDVKELVGRVDDVDGVRVLTEAVSGPDEKALLELLDRLKAELGDAAIVLGSAVDGRVALVASVSPALVERGVKAGSVVKAAAEVVGGGGGGRDTMARAGGRDPSKLGEALAAARGAIESALSGA
jgi:alanyl-tRNA synthetase